ncbi:MAG: hypothetical protein A2Y23_13295 [Clostridiales bacterium GWB2_37_7]|nr:MAG: hypothetical protein A2Y23_13295 [Clostridiales bacterium GWB2_37_7]
MDIEKLVDDFFESLPCKADQPYPETEVEGQNLRYAKLLMDAYSDGEKAEMTAITQYMHHHLTIQNKEIANVELCIALIEMKHLEMLGDLIKKLGGNPKYRNSNKSWWDGGQVAYGDTTEFKLKLDIEAEKAAIEGYKTLISEIKDKHVITALQRILDDEIVHLNILMALYRKYFNR